MTTYTKAVAVRFLATTNTRGSRLKASMVGHKPTVYGFHSFDGCVVAEEQAAKEYVLATLGHGTQIVTLKRVANPCNNDALFIVEYM